MKNVFQAAYHGDIQGGIMHRFHAEWIGGLLRIGDKGGPPFEDEKVISFGDLDATQAAQFAAWIIHRLPRTNSESFRAAELAAQELGFRPDNILKAPEARR